jgi:urea carboxylase
MFKPISRDEHDEIAARVTDSQFMPRMHDVRFDLREFRADPDTYNAKLMGLINGR